MNPEGDGLIDIRKDEREKTLDEVINYVSEMSVMASQRGVLKRLKQKFLAPQFSDLVEELAQEIHDLDAISSRDKDWDNLTDAPKIRLLKVARHILDNYEIKKKPADGV